LLGPTIGGRLMNTVRKSLLSLVILTAVLLCAAVPRLQAEDLDRRHDASGTTIRPRPVDPPAPRPALLPRIFALAASPAHSGKVQRLSRRSREYATSPGNRTAGNRGGGRIRGRGCSVGEPDPASSTEEPLAGVVCTALRCQNIQSHIQSV